MDLIYATWSDYSVQDVNILQDYSFDEVYGVGDKDINNYELVVQRYNNKVNMGDIVYLEFTEYGGVVDRIETNTKNGTIIYKGRSFHGIMNSFVIQPKSGFANVYSGEINSIMQQMAEDCGLPELFVIDAVPQSERSITIDYFAVRYEKYYDALNRLFSLIDGRGKLICYFHNGKVHIGGVRACDYSISDEFDTSQMPYRTGVTYHNVNHLICLGKGDDYDDRPVIHLYADTGGKVMEYKRIPHPLEDSEYILDDSNQVIRGNYEITEVFDYPNAAIITNYKKLQSEPADWNTQYFNKYYRDAVDSNNKPIKELVKQIKRDEYRLVTDRPTDWGTTYSNYYSFDTSKNDKKYVIKDGGRTYVEAKDGDDHITVCDGAFTNVKEINESSAQVIWKDVTASDTPPDWEKEYNTYFVVSGTSPTGYAAVQSRNYDTYGVNDNYDGLNNLVHDGQPWAVCPPDWEAKYSEYTTRTKDQLGNWVYGVSIVGNHNDHFEPRLVQEAPADWKKEDGSWRQYYYKITKKSKIYSNKNVNKIKREYGIFVTTTDAIAQGDLTYTSAKKKYPKYKPNKFYVLVNDADSTPSFEEYCNGTKGFGVYTRYPHSVAPVWDIAHNRYFRKELQTVPSFDSEPRYQKISNVEQIPDFYYRNYYYPVYDRLKDLAEKGAEKLKELNNTSTLDIELDLESNYDVGDIIGCTDDITQEPINKPILRKIIKIKKDILTVDYEVM